MIRTLLASLLTFVPLAVFASPARAAGDRPNIVFVLVDDLRFDDLGCTGHPFSRTPNADKLVAEGLLFKNAFATTPLCSPSRASFLTGLHANAHGITDNTDRSLASHKLDTFPKRLHDAGYRTAYVGKWHMGNDDSPRPGFDRWVCMKGQGDSVDPTFNVDGTQTRTTGYVTDVTTKYVTDFIKESYGSKSPFMIYVAHKALHPQTQQDASGKLSDPNADNFIPADRHKDLYEKDELPRRPNYAKPPTDKPALMQQIEGMKPLGADTVSSDRAIKNRLRMLAAVDESLGTIVETLRSTGALDDTLIVFTSDHGYFYGEHGLSTERRLAFEESIRIPMIMWNPKLIPSPRKVENTVVSIDLFPTFMELGHAKGPEKLHGRSLVPLIKGDASFPMQRDVLVQYFTDTVFARVRKMGYAAVRTDRWKYVQYKEQMGADELYDLQNDPYELKNVATDEGSASMLAEMKVRLAAAIETAK